MQHSVMRGPIRLNLDTQQAVYYSANATVCCDNNTAYDKA